MIVTIGKIKVNIIKFPFAIAAIAEPGHSPLKPHPTPNIDAPSISFLSQSGSGEAALFALERKKVVIKKTVVIAEIKTITKSICSPSLMLRNLITVSGFVIPDN